jgi:L-threonylcarbamoyladenylate synthase
MVETLLGEKISELDFIAKGIKTPGSFETHYSPNAKVILDELPSKGDGYIALENISTPKGAIRLASPKNNEEYAKILYESLRTADRNGLKKVFVALPEDLGVGVAIIDRLIKAAKR